MEVRRRAALRCVLAAGLVYLLIGCGGGGGGSTVLRGAVDGFVVTAASGVQLDYDGTPPTGRAPVAGAVVTLGGRRTTTDTAGRFVLADVPAGAGSLHVAPPAGTPLDVPVTIFPGATVRTGAPPVSRTAAVDRAATALSNAGIAADTYRLLAPQQPIPAGTTVDPALTVTVDPSTAAAPLAHARWLVYADLAPGARFGHPVRYVLVDPVTGATEIRTEESWPRVNGADYYANPFVNATSPDLIHDATRRVAVDAAPAPTPGLSRLAGPPAPRPADDLPCVDHRAEKTTRSHVSGCPQPVTYGFILQGTRDAGFDADNQNFRQLFVGGFPGRFVLSEFSPPTQAGVSQSPAGLIAAFARAAAQATRCDTFVLYIAAHSALLKGTASRVMVMDATSRADGGTGGGQGFSPSDFDLNKVKACHIVVVLDSCQSGQFVEGFASQLRGRKGLEWIVITSTDTVELSHYDASGSVFMKTFVANKGELNQIEAGPDRSVAGAFGRIFNQVKAAPIKGKTMEQVQGPKADGAIPLPGEECGVELYVTLARTLTAGAFTYPAGTKISLSRISGAHIAAAEGGCSSEHLHSDNPSEGFTIDGRGPFFESDAERRGCGIGTVGK